MITDPSKTDDLIVTLRSTKTNDPIRMAVEIPAGLAEGVGDGKLVLVRPKQGQPAVYAFRVSDHYRGCPEPKLGYPDFRMCQTVIARQNSDVLRAAGSAVSPTDVASIGSDTFDLRTVTP